MGSQMALAEMPRPCTTYMGCHLALVGKEKCKHKMYEHSRIATGSNMDSIWEAKRLLAASSFLACHVPVGF